MPHADTYDAVITGAGLGGLLCGAMLSREGMRVCLLEKNEQIGGGLQTFRRDGLSLDTGIHYLGALDRGQTLDRIFRYAGIRDRLKLSRMDAKGFDAVLFADHPDTFLFGMGYEAFAGGLYEKFPDEKQAVYNYCKKIQQTCGAFPLYNLNEEEQVEDAELLSLSTRSVIEGLTADQRLRAVLAGSNMLYAGEGDHSPWYAHALIINSFIQSSWRCDGGSGQIAALLARIIKSAGGAVLTKSEVVALKEEQGRVSKALLSDGREISGRLFISNLHPAVTLGLLSSNLIRPAYKSRIQSLRNSTSAFVLNLVLKPGTCRYSNRNYYFFRNTDVWKAIDYAGKDWPLTYGLFEAVPANKEGFLESASVMTYMRFEEVQNWQTSIHTNRAEISRGPAYEDFKAEKTQKLLDLVAERFPAIVKNIEKCYAATPLTYRDYLGSPQGSIYGIAKDYRQPLRTQVSPNTRLPNLYLTGQNIKLHGALGVAISAVVTCTAILGRQYLVRKIIQANEVAA